MKKKRWKNRIEFMHTYENEWFLPTAVVFCWKTEYYCCQFFWSSAILLFIVLFMYIFLFLYLLFLELFYKGRPKIKSVWYSSKMTCQQLLISHTYVSNVRLSIIVIIKTVDTPKLLLLRLHILFLLLLLLLLLMLLLLSKLIENLHPTV